MPELEPRFFDIDSIPRRSHPRFPRRFRGRHHMIVALHMAGLGNREIAQNLGITKERVSQILNDPRAIYLVKRFGEKFADLQVDVGKKIQDACHEAFDEVQDQMRNSTDERARRQCAFGILDRGGYSKIEKRIVARATIPPESARLMMDAVRESREIKASYSIEEIGKPEANGHALGPGEEERPDG